MEIPQGEALGALIKDCLDRKRKKGSIRSLAEVARLFGVTSPSIHGWMNHGRISSEKMPSLIAFFKDVSTPQEWGFEDWPDWIPEPPSQADLWKKTTIVHKGLPAIDPEQYAKFMDLWANLTARESSALRTAYATTDPEEQEILQIWRSASAESKAKMLKILRVLTE